MAKDETVLDSLKGLPQPRGQHYEFAHSALPDAVRSNPDGFLRELSGDGAGKMVLEIWNRCRSKFPSSEDRVDERGLAASAAELPGGRSCALVVLPPAERHGEAHMVAAVVVPGERRLGIFRKPPSVRYFTLEVAFESAERQTTALCEWEFTREGGRRHERRAAGVAAERAAFLAAVDEALGG
jgi:hypothetical protein